MASVEGIATDVYTADLNEKAAIGAATRAKELAAEIVAAGDDDSPALQQVQEVVTALFARLRASAQAVNKTKPVDYTQEAHLVYTTALEGSVMPEGHPDPISLARHTMMVADTLEDSSISVIDKINDGERQLTGMLRFVLGAIATEGGRMYEAAQEMQQSAEATVAASEATVRRISSERTAS